MDKRQELTIRQLLDQPENLSKRQELILRRALAGETAADDAFSELYLRSLRSPKSFEEKILERRGKSIKEEQQFDRKSGIQSAKLRSALGAAENKKEEDNILYKFGLTQSDFVRDRRGNLALTPDGATKFGVKTDKNIVIDEEGFSKYDLADLVAISPELAGAIGGAAGGQAIIPIPILGAMIGGFFGGAAGSLAEEGIEGLAGVSSQTAGDIVQDALVEGSLAAVGEGVVGLVGKGFNVIKKGPQSRADEDTIRAVGMGREEFGITADPGRAGFQPILARAFAIGEKIFGGSKRTRENGIAIQNAVKEFRDASGAVDPMALGSALFAAREAGKTKLTSQVNEAQKKVLNQFKNVANDLGRAAKDDVVNINQDLYDSWKGAYTDFLNLAGAQFKSIDDAVKSAAGESNIIPVGDIKRFAKDNAEQFRGSVLTDSTGTTVTALNSLKELGRGKNASFAQLYNARKSLNDFINMNPKDTTLERYGGDLLKMIDNKLEYSNIEDLLDAAGTTLTESGRRKILKAAEDIPDARTFYRKGMTAWNEVAGISNLSAIRKEIKELGRANTAGMMNRIVKPNNPDLLIRAEEMLKGNWEPLRKRIAGEWIRENIEGSINVVNPKNFSGTSFRTKVNNLGATGVKLFGKREYGELKRLADQMAATSLARADESVLQRVSALTNADEPNIGLLKDVAKAQKNQLEFDTDRILKQLDSGDLDEVAAANIITSPNTAPTTIRKLVTYFDDPNDLQKLRGVYMENLIGDFSEKFLSEPGKMAEFGARLQREAQAGRLKELFGPEMAGRMRRFGEVLSFNAKTTDGGPLIASGIAAAPLENLGKLARFGLITRMLSTDLFYKNIDDQYRALTGKASRPEKARTLGKLIGNGISRAIAQTGAQAIDETTVNAKQAAESLIRSEIDEQKRLSDERSQRAPKPAPTPIPKVLPSLDRGVSAAAPVSQPQDILGQIRQRAVEKRNIRQRARENPAIAATLLGGLGSAGLL